MLQKKKRNCPTLNVLKTDKSINTTTTKQKVNHKKYLPEPGIEPWN